MMSVPSKELEAVYAWPYMLGRVCWAVYAGPHMLGRILYVPYAALPLAARVRSTDGV